MKKLVSFVMAAVLCVGMTTTVLAANSADTNAVKDTAGSISYANSETVTGIELTPVSTEVEEEITEKSFAKDTAREFLGYAGVKTATTLAYFDVEADNYGDITFYSKSINKGDNILVLHYCEEHDKWENIKKEVGDGYVVATFHSYSPVAIVEYTTHPTYDYSDSVDEATSPKTADVAMFGLYAAVALTGTVVAARKAKASK